MQPLREWSLCRLHQPNCLRYVMLLNVVFRACKADFTPACLADKCTAGSFSERIGSVGPTECRLCNNGTVAAGESQIECKDCPVGEIAASKGQDQCKPCVAGKIADDPASTECAVRGQSWCWCLCMNHRPRGPCVVTWICLICLICLICSVLLPAVWSRVLLRQLWRSVLSSMCGGQVLKRQL